MARRNTFYRMPYAGNPHVRFDEGEVASAMPSRWAMLCSKVNSRDSNKILVFFAVLLSAAVSMAFNSDTIAFYPFNEGSAGDTVVGATVSNAVSPGTHDGTPSLVGSGTNADIAYDDDAPGKYLYDEFAYKAPILFENPKSISFSSPTVNGTACGGKIEFTDVGTALSGGADYTVEFFFKIPADGQSHMKKWNGVVSYDCGTYCTYLAAYKSVSLVWYDANTLYGSAGDLNNFRTYIKASDSPTVDTSLADGRWHHFAVIYNATKKTLVEYLDYGNANGGKSGTTLSGVENAQKPSGFPLELGNGNFHGKICGLRVSKAALGLDHLLRATDDPDVMPQTAFHLSLDGAAGTTASTLLARVGCVGEATAGSNPLVYTDDCASPARRPLVTDGTGEIYGTNTSAACIRTVPDVYWPNGSGAMVKGSSYSRCDSGDFTLEGFFKHDFVTQTNNFDSCSEPVYRRFTIFGMKNAAYNMDFVLVAVYHPTYKNWYLQGQIYDVNNTLKSTGQISSPVCLTDGKWHHYSLVYDDSALTLKVYIDYEVAGTANMTAPYRPRGEWGSRDIMFGTGLNNGTMEGCIDEVRFSHAKLEPSEFLKFTKTKLGMIMLMM